MVESYNDMIQRYEASGPDKKDPSYLLNEIAFFLDLNAKYDGAKPLYQRALAITERVLGPEHPNTATSINNLAELLDTTGKYEEAEPLYRKAIEMLLRVSLAMQREHPNLLLTCKLF